MRNFDNWNRYQDNSGNPLRGCVQFNVKDGDTVAPVYDSDDTPLDNPQLTDIYGRTQHQVFVDQDVVAYFYKFVGEGDWTGQEDIDTSDVTKWSLQYTSENVSDVVVHIDTDAVNSVNTMSNLRNIDPDEVPEIDGMKILTLLGYNETGDKEPIDYIWEPESEEFDNGGSVIQHGSQRTGRWIMVQPTEHCDSRHFGVFPSDSYNMDYQTYGIQKLFEYCNVKGIRPFFNGSSDSRWFRYSSISVFASEIDVSNGTMFYDDGTSTISGKWNGNPYFSNGNTALVCPEASTSWNASSYTGLDRIVVDMPTQQTSWQGCEVVLEIPVTGNIFNDCAISETGNLKGEDNSFVNCKLTGAMFGDDASISGKTTGCRLDIDDFVDRMDLYVQYRMTGCTNPNIDFKNIETSEKPVILYSSTSIDSAVIRINNYNSSVTTPVVIEKLDNTILEISNCTGVFNLGAYTTGSTVYVKDCTDLEIRTIGGGCILMVENSRIVMGQNARIVFSMSAANSSITSDYDITTSQYGHFTAFNCILNIPVTSNNLVIKDSQVNAPVNYVANGEGSIYFENNIVNNTLTLSGDSAGNRTIVGLIANNYGNAGTPIAVSRTYLDSVDSHHSYSYYNNGGTFPKRSVSFTENTTVIPDIQNFTGSEWFWTLAEGQYGYHDPYIGFATYYYDDGQAYYRHHFKFQTQFTLFRIGTDDQEVKVEWKLNSSNSSSSGFVTPNPFYAKIVHTSGESYRLEGIWTGGEPTSPTSAQGYNTAYFNAATSVQSLGTATFNNTYSFEL